MLHVQQREIINYSVAWTLPEKISKGGAARFGAGPIRREVRGYVARGPVVWQGPRKGQEIEFIKIYV